MFCCYLCIILFAKLQKNNEIVKCLLVIFYCSLYFVLQVLVAEFFALTLELKVKCEANAVLLKFIATIDITYVVVVEAAYVLNGEHFEDIANANRHFHVRLLAH